MSDLMLVVNAGVIGIFYPRIGFFSIAWFASLRMAGWI